MKRLLLLFVLFLAVSTIYAQRGRVAAASALIDNGDLQGAKERLEDAFEHNRTMDWPRTYVVAAELATAEYAQGAGYERILDAVEYYKKAVEFDLEEDEDKGFFARIFTAGPGRFEREIKLSITMFEPELQNAGIEAFNENRFELAADLFESVIKLNKLPIYEEDDLPADSVFIYYTAISASRSEQWDRAEKYFKQAIELGYEEGDPVLLLHEVYENTGDSAKIAPNLQRGFEKFPEDERILTTMINYYLQTEQNDEALKYLEEALAQEPDNYTFHNAMGVLHDENEDYDKAIESYQNALEIDPEFFDALLNIGVIYFNRGADGMMEANEMTDQADYEAARDEAMKEFEKALPYIEKAHEVNPEEPMVLETLRNLYYRFDMMDKYNEADQKLQELRDAPPANGVDDMPVE
ncbi:tetratricopeptide repeat protein [Marinilabiliaceae bacterium ANBcel2]|nr:tetratricopeptide repeat protein [Marinilabiliaceae bacterium ANBcel2]